MACDGVDQAQRGGRRSAVHAATAQASETVRVPEAVRLPSVTPVSSVTAPVMSPAITGVSSVPVRVMVIVWVVPSAVTAVKLSVSSSPVPKAWIAVCVLSAV